MPLNTGSSRFFGVRLRNTCPIMEPDGHHLLSGMMEGTRIRPYARLRKWDCYLFLKGITED